MKKIFICSLFALIRHFSPNTKLYCISKLAEESYDVPAISVLVKTDSAECNWAQTLNFITTLMKRLHLLWIGLIWQIPDPSLHKCPHVRESLRLFHMWTRLLTQTSCRLESGLHAFPSTRFHVNLSPNKKWKHWKFVFHVAWSVKVVWIKTETEIVNKRWHAWSMWLKVKSWKHQICVQRWGGCEFQIMRHVFSFKMESQVGVMFVQSGAGSIRPFGVWVEYGAVDQLSYNLGIWTGISVPVYSCW